MTAPQTSGGESPDVPFYDAIAGAQRLHLRGWTTLQKFTCAGCGNRLTIEVPNVFYTKGTCDNCTTLTDIEARGCNYMALSPGAWEAMQPPTES